VPLPPLFFSEPDRLLRHLRHHDLKALRCAVHGRPPGIVSSAEGLTITVCCRSLEDLVGAVLGS
jgi:hypothetical protein